MKKSCENCKFCEINPKSEPCVNCKKMYRSMWEHDGINEEEEKAQTSLKKAVKVLLTNYSLRDILHALVESE